MNKPPPKYPPAIPPRPARSRVDEELLAFIQEQRSVDLIGEVRRIADLFMRHDAEDKERHRELKGEIKGLSLRVGELERKSDKQESRLDDSQRIILYDAIEKKREAEEKVSFLKKHGFGIIASILAIASTVWHFFR